LLLRSLAGQYISGVAWSWTASESWQLLVWLFYAIMWMAWAVRGWHGRRMQLLVAVGPALALLVLNAWAR
jgi:ABC-type transport system involved in cytochrome c biogenesis permease subunit